MENNFHLPLFFILLLSITITPGAARSVRPSAIYAFGDSFLDSGNNNNLGSLCRANHKPYGTDFSGQSPTGRFSNGKLPGDFLVAAYGIKNHLPSYSESYSDAGSLRTGASFASACSGYYDVTSKQVGVLNMDTQFKNFEKAFLKMEQKFGIKKATATVQGALFIISAGTSDMVENYYLRPSTRKKYSLPAYHDLLLKKLDMFVKKLYKVGAKKLAIIGLPPVGCLPVDTKLFSPSPSQKDSNSTGGPSPSQKDSNSTAGFLKRECNQKHNTDSKEYNAKLRARVKKMTVSMPKLNMAYVDLYSPLKDFIDMPYKYGFKTTLEGCCGSVSMEAGPFCNMISLQCHARNEYVFWDSINPSQAAYKILSKKFKAKALHQLFPKSV